MNSLARRVVVITVALSNKPNQGRTSERIMVEASPRQEQDGMQVIIIEVRVQVKMFCHKRPETYWPEDGFSWPDVQNL